MEKVRFRHSISGKILSVVVMIMIVFMISSGLCSYIQTKKLVANMSENYILTLAEQGAQTIGEIPPEIATFERYAGVIKGIDMKGIQSDYAYMVDSDGIMYYHPNHDKIGKPVENEVIRKVVQTIQSGTIPEEAVVEYQYQGETKYAAYSISTTKMIVVVTADQAEIMAPIRNVIRAMAIASALTIILGLIICYRVSLNIGRPIQQLTQNIEKTARLDFTPTQNGKTLRERKDETGYMARQIHDMRRSLRDMVRKINDSSEHITMNVDGLQQISNMVNGMCMDNSATTEELAAGMEETAATTISINENVQGMKVDAGNISVMAQEGADASKEVMERAKKLGEKTETASARTLDMYKEVKEKSNQAIEGAKAVDKINELTDAIMQISSQTGLLALNASIEAARAGEAGRGFAVVATEIGSLADQTTKAVSDIGEIVKEVNSAVSNMINCMENTTDFLETTVLADYQEFKEVSILYQEDATAFGNNMNEVKEAVVRLSQMMEVSADALNNIKDTVNETAAGVTDIAEKTSDMVRQSGESTNLVSVCHQCSDTLKEIVNQFKLENTAQ